MPGYFCLLLFDTLPFSVLVFCSVDILTSSHVSWKQQTIRSNLEFFFTSIFILYVSVFCYMDVCALHACPVPVYTRSEHQILWDWSPDSCELS